MRKWIGLMLTGCLLGSLLPAAAQGNRSGVPMLRVSCNVSQAKISVEDGDGEAMAVGDKPVQLKPGVQYTLVVAAPGYRSYRRSFAAEWKGLREKEVVLEKMRTAAMVRDFGPMDGEVWVADLEDSVRMEFVPVPAGSFMMGSEEGEADELPVHKVEFSRPFWMAKTEVTNQQYDQYQQFLNAYMTDAQQASAERLTKKLEKNEVPMPAGAQFPVSNISWEEAIGFCEWLTKKERRRGRLPEGYEYTLPTEAEWEYACRAGSTEAYAGKLDAMGWYKRNSSERTNPVGTKNPNAWGLHDMHGNVWEWCVDIWYASYRNAPVDGSQRGLAFNEYEVDRSRMDEPGNTHRLYNPFYRSVRGGCWSYPASACRSANRYYHVEDFRLNYLGFRPVILWNPPVTDIQTTTRLEEGL